MASSNIPITFVNNTGVTDFETLVLSESYVAWHVINTQTSAEFVYPDQSEVSAKYEDSGVTYTSGPFNANPGSTWVITQDDPDSATILAEDKNAPTRPDGGIEIKNQKPKSWSGRSFEVGIYKHDVLLLSLPNLRVNEEATFIVRPIIYFGVKPRTGIQQGDIVSKDDVQGLTKIDLSTFPNGVKVSLNKNEGREFVFTVASA